MKAIEKERIDKKKICQNKESAQFLEIKFSKVTLTSSKKYVYNL